jgi:hypothetical protein
MINDLIILSELAEHLGYTDERSVLNWCRKNKIMVIHAGKRKYVPSELMRIYYEKQFEKYISQHYDNATQIMDNYCKGDTAGLAEKMDVPIDRKAKKNYEVKVERSKAALDFLNKLKSA